MGTGCECEHCGAYRGDHLLSIRRTDGTARSELRLCAGCAGVLPYPEGVLQVIYHLLRDYPLEPPEDIP